MTDKQIIIDSVDVSKSNKKYAEKSSSVSDLYKAEINTVDGINLAECVHFTRQYNYGYCELSNDSCNEFNLNCVKNKNCYYKQLKRKEQECEELKEINAEIEESEIELGNMTNRLLVDYMKYRQVIDGIAKLISDALASPPPEKTETEESFKNFAETVRTINRIFHKGLPLE